ncbi:glucokinase [Rhizobium sp. R72]|uniref:ROK family protein n=1 Tax=unclassified Rhizobium TaxID=2613769 RepID=UPI000B52E199|nr:MULTISPECIES: ROK family protein [unclassified Rhizobium]OWW00151.1 glucokinase [Rhizobium sp. R72]OWW00542.1 glucokinase [Rhizobium sp. R711]
MPKEIASPLLNNGATVLPSVTVNCYNLELRDGNGFIGDRANRQAFQQKLENCRQLVCKGGRDPLGDTATEEMSKKQIDALLNGKNLEASALILGAIEEYAAEFAYVLQTFLKDERWKETQRIVVGGGLKDSAFCELAIARAMVRLKSEGLMIELVPIAHHPDDAGLLGAAHLMHSWMLNGYDGILAVDIGGANIRAGVVETRLEEHSDLSKARVWKSHLWRYGDEPTSRKGAVAKLTDMLGKLIDKAVKENFSLAPLIGVACPGVIEADGSIARGAQNLPGGNWERDGFNLTNELAQAFPKIGNHDTLVLMHNDGVVQGLSQIPFVQDVKHWGIVTIGTGFGNTNMPPDKTIKKKG